MNWGRKVSNFFIINSFLKTGKERKDSVIKEEEEQKENKKIFPSTGKEEADWDLKVRKGFHIHFFRSNNLFSSDSR